MSNAGMRSETCKNCGSFNTCSSPFQTFAACGDSVPQKPLLIVGELPTMAEDDTGELLPGHGKHMGMLRRTLKKCGVEIDSVVYTVAVRCLPPNDKNPSAKQINCCREFLMKEIALLKPKAIFLLGNTALRVALKQSGITKKRSTMFAIEVDGTTYPAVAGFSPGFVLRDANQLSRFEADVKFFANVAAGKKKSIDTSVINLHPTVDDIKAFAQNVRDKKLPIAFDAETDELEPYTRSDWKLLCASISDGKRALVVEFDKCGMPNAKRIRTLSAAQKEFLNVLKDSTIPKIAHNAKYDKHIFAVRFDVQVKRLVADTMLMHSHCFPIIGGHGLKEVASELLGIDDYTQPLRSYIGEGGDAKKYGLVPYDLLGLYCGGDGIVTVKIASKLRAEMQRMDAQHAEDGVPCMKPSEVFPKLIMRMVPALFAIERTGFYVRRPYMNSLQGKLEEERKEALGNLQKLPCVAQYVKRARFAVYEDYKKRKEDGKRTDAQRVKARMSEITFNPNSPVDMAAVIYGNDYYAQPRIVQTQSGEESTAMPTLRTLLLNNTDDAFEEFVSSVETVKSLGTLNSTFVEGLKKHIGTDGRVHSSFRIGGTDTGRVSSADPNLQNQPRVERIRSMWGAPDGCELVEGDYSQMELRVLAAYSQDKRMLRVYSEDRDIHTETAMRVYGYKKSEQVTKEQRTACKSTNFGIAYGMGAYGLARKLSIELGRIVDNDEAQQYIDGFYSAYPGVEAWQNEVREFAEAHGYVYTMFGTRRLIKNAQIKVKDKSGMRLKEDAMRQAVNTPVQGTAGLITLVALNALRKSLLEKPFMHARVVSTVHDSIIVECKADSVKECIVHMRNAMVQEPHEWIGEQLHGVPIKVDFKHGTDWGIAKE